MTLVSGESFHTVVRQLWGGVSRITGKDSPFLRMGPPLARYLFRVNVVTSVHHHLWDETSLVLRKAIDRYVDDGDRVLDLGTGQAGLLAIYCSTLRDVEIHAVDVNQEYLRNAQSVARANACESIRFSRSDWLSNVRGSFDLIWANIPYIPTDIGMRGPHRQCPRDVWDGGDDGFEHGRRILREVEYYLAPEGRFLLGVNTAYVPRRVTVSAVQEYSHLALYDVVSIWWLPSEVYVIGLGN